MTFLYEIFGTALRWIFNFAGNYGLSVVLFSVFAKIITIPLSYMQFKSTQMMKAITPLQNQIQKKFAHDKMRANQEVQNLYKKLNYKPFSSCLPLLIQLPIMIGLFGVLREPVPYVFDADMYDSISKSFLWIADLNQTPLELFRIAVDSKFFMSLIIPVASIGLTFYSQKLTTPQEGQDQNKMMMIVMNAVIAYMSFTFNQGLAIYWSMNTALSIIQTLLMQKYVHVEIPEVKITTRKKK